MSKPKLMRRVGVREGYDAWAESYDGTANPLVALDRRHTLAVLAPKPREAILDAGCGTGVHLGALLKSRSRPFGFDLSRGMLKVARRRLPAVPLAQADLEQSLPAKFGRFDAILCALVGEHLEHIAMLFREFYGLLRPAGRLVFSVFHPEMAAAGLEANFERAGVEYRLGARTHTVADYLSFAHDAGFRKIVSNEFGVDSRIVSDIQAAKKYLNHPLLFIISAQAG